MKTKSLAAAALSLAAAAILAGCGVNDYTLAQPTDLPDAPRHSQTPWYQSFNDAMLANLISKAMANNEDIKIAANSLEIAKSYLSSAQRDRWPSINGTAGASWSKREGVHPTARGFNIGAQLSWQLDFYGTLAHKASIAELTAEQSKLALAKARDLIAFGVAKLYFQINSALLEQDILDKFARLQSEQIAIYQRQLRLGAISKTDYSKLRADYEKTLISKQNAETKSKKLIRALAALAYGVDEQTAAVPVSKRLPDIAMPAQIASSELLNRPDISSYALEVAKKHFSAKIARNSFFPQFSINVTASSGAADARDVLANPVYALGVNLLQPIFNLANNKAALNRANIEQSSAVLRYEQGIKTALKEIYNTIIDYRSASANLERYSEVIALERMIFADARTRYDAGETSMLDLLDSQRALLRSELEQNQLRLARIIAAIDLFDASGLRFQPE